MEFRAKIKSSGLRTEPCGVPTSCVLGVENTITGRKLKKIFAMLFEKVLQKV